MVELGRDRDERLLLVGGSWVDGSTGSTFEVIDPATGAAIGTVADGGPDDAMRACDAAGDAQPRWATLSPRERSEILRSCFEALRQHRDELAELITTEQGKPRGDALGEVDYSAEFFRWNAEEAVRIHGSLAMAPSGSNRIVVRHPPVGVVVVITPWNFPAAMIARKLAPALAAGNAVVVKPPAETPLTALRLAELMSGAGVPPGVVNVVPTTEPGPWFEAAVDHPATRMVSFTGSTATGKLLLRRSADRVLRTAMELGGNAPFIVFDDADLDAAIEGAMVAKMRHSAQTCTAANRFFVHEAVADDFTERLVTAMGSVVVGNGFDPKSTCGPLISDAAITRVSSVVDEATGLGATLRLGGRRHGERGFFYEPTVLTDVVSSAPIASHELFGPVAPITTFSDTDVMLEEANSTELGLAAYVYTSDIGRGLAVSERIQSGMVGLNRGAISDPAAPFGGMKESGLGREGASDGIYEFCETQYIATSW